MLPNDAPVPLKFAPDTPVLLSFFARANQNCGSGIRYVFSLWASPWGYSHTRVSTPRCLAHSSAAHRVVGTSKLRLADLLTTVGRAGAPFPPQHHAPPLPSSRRARGAAVTPPPFAPARVERRLAAAAASSSSSARARERHREARAKLERAFAHVFPSGTGDDRIDPGSTVYSVPTAASAPSATPTRATSRSSVGSSSHPPRTTGWTTPRPRPRSAAQTPRGVGPRPRTRHHPSRRGRRDFDARSTPEMSLHRLRASQRHRARARGDRRRASPSRRSSRSISSTSCTSRARHRRGGRTSASFPRTWARP